MSSTNATPNYRQILYTRNSITGFSEYVTSTNHKLDVNATATLSGSSIPITGATTAVGVAIVDGSGNQITSFGGGTQYTQGGATVANPTGTAGIWFDGSGNPKAVTPSQPLPSNITDGTNTANILKSDGTAIGQNAQFIAGTGFSTATLTLNSGTPNTIWFDILNYPAYSVEILTNTTPATLTFQTSGDTAETNIRSTLVYDSQSNNGAPSPTSTSTNATLFGFRSGRYLRVSSNNGAGSTTLVITFYTTASSASTVGGMVVVLGSQSPADGVVNNSNLLINGPEIFNGTTWDRQRSATSVAGTTGTGLPSAGVLGWDGTNYQRLAMSTADSQVTTGVLAAGGMTFNGSTFDRMSGGNRFGDGGAATGSVLIAGLLYNGATFDRQRNNVSGVIVAANTTGTTSNVAITTFNATKLVVVVNVTSGAGSVQITISGKTSSNYTYLILQSTALVGVAATELRVFPGATPTTNLVANDMIPPTLNVTATVIGTITYGVDYVLGN